MLLKVSLVHALNLIIISLCPLPSPQPLDERNDRPLQRAHFGSPSFREGFYLFASRHLEDSLGCVIERPSNVHCKHRCGDRPQNYRRKQDPEDDISQREKSIVYIFQVVRHTNNAYNLIVLACCWNEYVRNLGFGVTAILRVYVYITGEDRRQIISWLDDSANLFQT